MTEKEYREFLEAVSKRHLDLRGERFGPGYSDLFRHDLKRLSQTYRFVQVVGERSDDVALYNSLGEELSKGGAPSVFAAMARTGVTDALDQYGEIIFANLSKDLLPAEEANFLREAGISEPEAELVILIFQGRRLAQASARSSDILKRASTRLAEVAEELKNTPQSDAAAAAKPKPKKYFNRIGKILSGAILGGGNLLIGTGAVVASGGAVGAAIIASCATAVAVVGQGVGDLRGE